MTERLTSYRTSKFGPLPDIQRKPCLVCKKPNASCKVDFQKHPGDITGWVNILRGFTKCTEPECEAKPIFFDPCRSEQEITEYQVYYELELPAITAEKNRKAAVVTALTTVRNAKFLTEEVLEDARAAVVAAEEAERSAKALVAAVNLAEKATNKAATIISGATSIRPRKTRKVAAGGNSSSPAKRKSDTDSSPSARAKRARIGKAPVAGPSKPPVAGPSKLPVAGSSKSPVAGSSKVKAEEDFDDDSVIEISD